MATYDYQCRKCGKSFSATHPIQEHSKVSVACPKCKSTQVEQKFAALSVQTSKKS